MLLGKIVIKIKIRKRGSPALFIRGQNWKKVHWNMLLGSLPCAKVIIDVHSDYEVTKFFLTNIMDRKIIFYCKFQNVYEWNASPRDHF